MRSDAGMGKHRDIDLREALWLGLADQTDVCLLFALYVLLYCSDRSGC